jgi:hypothetical protein
VDGEARGLAVSEGHLVVSTTTGRVYVFGEKGRFYSRSEELQLDSDAK